ncbi:MAG: prephenate dehydrogenase [Sulfurovum sp.]|nr:prephenate dehydrogenase [Sulfurovum sp.]MCB4754524.1 prephenate dehydrogenase [Sulfurovum sp.]MCB4760753.1 prephenate dehydrogenase [Sulfurovum sp.]MCB4764071.1 prephenate dehydrogenase [Sulfurovum sp.]MCB4766070.1 prephenate dehydrogenase [Sulfurovum sp.]
MSVTQIGIVGLGLMGGSLSLALKKTHSSYYFIGLDHNPRHCSQALKLGLVNEIVDSLEALSHCDIIILTIPVDGIIAIIKEFKPTNANCTVIDLGSTKAKISESIPKEIRHLFVTAHPMTGTEKFGPTAALSDLYKEKVIVFCDIEKSGKNQQKTAKNLFTKIGMKLVYMGTKEHDRHAAFISHMPHALSYALANTVMRQEDPESIVALAGGGFRDMSRIAKSSPNMWEDVFRQNKENILEAIGYFQKELKLCKKMVENEEWESLNAWMEEANKLHDIL